MTLGVQNASFVAQTAEWMPAHLYATLRAAYHHEGFAFVRVLQRCPVFTPSVYQIAVQKPERIELLVHEDGKPVGVVTRQDLLDRQEERRHATRKSLAEWRGSHRGHEHR